MPLTPGSRSWVLGALLSTPLIDGGPNKANVTRGEAALEESVAAYRQSVLVVFAEVEESLEQSSFGSGFSNDARRCLDPFWHFIEQR